jgi:hypothetical protein
MAAEPLGIEGFTDEDARFAGSRFSEVRDAVFANPYQKVWGAPGEPPLPVYPVTLGLLLRDLLSRAGFPFLAAARRAVSSHADLRWGPDRQGFRRLLHPNGVCLTGMWEIAADTPYSGYFRRGSRGLIVARYSTCCTATRRGQTRSLALVGRVYPTTDPEHGGRLPTAGFITQEDLGGSHSRSINEAVVRNAPDTRSWRRGAGVPALLLTGLVFMKSDKQPSIRQLYQLAELGKPAAEPTRAPEFMQLTVDPAQPVIAGDGIDFRDEVMAQIYDSGDPQPKRKLVFRIETSDRGTTRGLPVYERREITDWRTIGTLTFDRAVASFNGDRVLNFSHPVWREDRNDPLTANEKGRGTPR